MCSESDSTQALTQVQSRGPRGCVLRVIDGPDAGRELEIKESAVIGTKPQCDLQLSDQTVSGNHLQLQITAEGILATDLDSKNGTYYLETRIESASLQCGAVLAVGHSRLLLASTQQAPGPGCSTSAKYGELIGSSPAMRRLYAALERLEQYDVNVLILGETGAGKECVAQEIHRHSTVAKGPFEVCDCTSLPPNLAESELFGHVKGAFTGAQSDYRGVFERAQGGSVFLDEMGEFPMTLQPKLLRVLEARSVRRVGSEKSIQINARVISATNRELSLEVTEKRFREDLFFRLNTVTVRIPPLRERREDIPSLVRHFLDNTGQALNLSPATVELFTTGYDWPGNVRELKNAVTRFQIMGSVPEGIDVSATDDIAEPGAAATLDLPRSTDDCFNDAKKRLVEAFERDYISTKMTENDNNISQAARAAGMERNHLKRLLRKHGLLS